MKLEPEKQTVEYQVTLFTDIKTLAKRKGWMVFAVVVCIHLQMCFVFYKLYVTKHNAKGPTTA